MGGEAAALILRSGLIVLQRRDDVEGIEPSVFCVADVNDLAAEVVGQLGVFVLRIQNKDLGIIRRHIYQQRLGAIGFTGAGFSDDDHIGIDPFGIPSEKVDKYRHTLALT